MASQFTRLGQYLSVASDVRVGESLRVYGTGVIEGGLSVTASSRVGSTMSVLGNAQLGGAVSLVRGLSVASSLSVRSFARPGQYVSVEEYVFIKGVVSVASSASCASDLSVFNRVDVGGRLSVFDVAMFGGDLSINKALQRFRMFLCHLFFSSFSGSLDKSSTVRLGLIDDNSCTNSSILLIFGGLGIFKVIVDLVCEPQEMEPFEWDIFHG